MEYPKAIMKMSELKSLGFPQPLLMEAYRDPKQNFATKVDPSKPNSTIIFDTAGFDKWVAKDLSGEHLEGLAFDDRALSQASFRGAYLDGTKFIDAILVGVDFEGASFVQANLTEANLQDTNIITAEFDNTIGIYPVCPTEGSFTGWTLAEDRNGNECLVEVFIPAWADGNSGTTRRCRAEALHIESIERLKDNCILVEATLKFRDYILTEKEYVYDEDFEADRFKTSSTDLYFWISKEEALAHVRKKI